MSVSTKTLQILPQKRTIFFVPGENLLDVLNANNFSINQSCGASGSCTTCRIVLLSSPTSVGPRSEIESERATERGFLDNERLACQTILLDAAKIEIPQVV